MTLIYVTIAWLIGTLLARQTGITPLAAMLVALALALLAALAWSRATLRRVALLGLIMALGGARYAIAQPSFDQTTLAYYNGQGKVALEGYVSAEPEPRGTYTQLQVTARSLWVDGTETPIQGRVLVGAPVTQGYTYGQRLRLMGRLEQPPTLEGFSYKEYLSQRGIHSVIERADVEVLSGYDGSTVLRWAALARSRLNTTVERLVPAPESGLLAGMLLGVDDALPEDLAEAYRRTGLTHILVISGYNFSLVLQAVLLVGVRLSGRRVTLWMSLLVILAYGMLVGFSPPVQRAGLMAALFIGAQLTGRRTHSPTSLAAATLVMSLLDPYILWSVSFQLSFMATVALILVEPALSHAVQSAFAARVARDRLRQLMRVLREVLLTSMAAQLLTLPILWYHFQELSLIAPLSNALVLVAQSPIMVVGMVALSLGALWLPLGRLLGLVMWPLLRYSIVVPVTLARWPLAAIEMPHLSLVGLMGLYALMAAGLMAIQGALIPRLRAWCCERNLVTAATGALALGTLLIWLAMGRLPDGRLHVYFMDVGQGDAILLRSPAGRTVLIDGGSDPVLLASRLGQILPFWQHDLDLVAVTHADQDHLGGLVPLVTRYQVRQILQPLALGQEGLAVTWADALARQDLAPIVASPGMRLDLGDGLWLEALHPAPGSGGDENQRSLVLRAGYGACELLLTGDINAKVEESLLQAGAQLGATVLKVAHHGSAEGSTEAFLARVAPQVAVISVGAGNRLGHPAEAVLQRLEQQGCQVYRTDLHGTVAVISDGTQLWVECGAGCAPER